jgi:hypothetical protein
MGYKPIIHAASLAVPSKLRVVVLLNSWRQSYEPGAGRFNKT